MCRLKIVLLISFFSVGSSDLYGQYSDIGQDPLEWFSEPHSVFSSEVKMSVKVPEIQGQLEYRFECVGGDGYSSEWQSSNEFSNSGLTPETKYSYCARVRRAGTSDEVTPSTGIYEVTTRRSTNTENSRYIPEIDRAFANGEIELIPIRVTGDKDNRINFCAINRWVEGKPDSYNTPLLREEFITDAKHSFRTFIPGDTFAIEPYPEYRDFFNLYAIWWPGMPAYNWKTGLTTVDLDEIRDRLFLPWNKEGKGWVSCLAMVNTDYGGGGAARNIETRTGNAMIAGRETEAFIHEFAHTAPGLPDEYTSNGVWGRGGEGSNTTLDYLAEDVKWRAWIEPGTEIPTPYSPENMDKVGVFEGATHRLHHIYRPTARGCIMGAGSFAGDPDGLCPVCVQRTVCRLYMWVDPFDATYPARKDLDVEIPGKVHFSVDQIVNLSGSQKLSWLLNGDLIAGDVSEIDITFEDKKEYRVECRLVDESEFVRPDPPYIDYPVASVKWVVNENDQTVKPDHQTGHKSLGDEKESETDTKVNIGPGTISLSVSEIVPSTGSYNNGAVRIKVEGGKSPCSFAWSDGKITDIPTRHFLVPGGYAVKVTDSVGFIKELDFEIEKVPGFYVTELEFKNSGKGKVSISNPGDNYSYFWYENDIPDYVPKFPNGKFYGSGKKANGDEFKAVATVVENRGGVFIKDTSKNDFGSWIYLKVYRDGDNELPVEFEIKTAQDGRFASELTIKDQKTEQIIYNDNYQFNTEDADITWNGIIRDGYMEIWEQGYMESKMKLNYSSAYTGREEALGEGREFEPDKSGNYYVEACDLKTGARSLNRLGVAITEKVKRNNKTISPDEIKSSELQMWLDANDLDADGDPDGNLFRRGSANGGKSKAGEMHFHFFNYFPNKQNGKPVLSWQTIWIQGLSKPINHYQTIIMVRKESDFSSEGTAPWRELDSLIGIGSYGEKLFADDISSSTTNGNVWINSERVDPQSASMPKGFYIATYEFSEQIDNPFKITDGHWEGELTEVLVFNSRLSEKERKGVEEYLYRKWISGVSY
ncbi:MAG: hypothetical protein GY790_14080 [Bacteroidetes bacterium]|nr:hypothetical protein [Bacteroidota bacterium]